MDNILAQLANADTFVFDIDGVLTDGRIWVSDDGVFMRNMNIKDGYALQLAVKKHYNVWIISGAKNEGAGIRLRKLGIEEVHLGVENKAALLKVLMEKYGVLPAQAIYMGDDMPDIEAMCLCGIKTCPADAAKDVLVLADYISPLQGGNGCVRDIIEKVLKIKGHFSE